MSSYETSNFIIRLENNLIGSFLLFASSTILFDFVLSRLIKSKIESTITEYVDKSVKKVTSKLSTNIIHDLVKQLRLNDLIQFYDKPSEVITENNRLIISQAYLISFALLVMICTIYFVVLHSCNQHIPMKNLIIENTVITIVIGILQLLFYKYFATQYIPIDIHSILKNLHI